MTDQALFQAFPARRPVAIWQKAFDYDTSHFEALCRCRAEGSAPKPEDLYDYALDLTYEEIQPDLLRYLWPLYLRAWRKHLHQEREDYGAFSSQCWQPLLARPGLVLSLLHDKELDAAVEYLAASVLAAIDAGKQLYSSGMHAYCHHWFPQATAMGALLPSVFELVWPAWWNVATPGRAIGALQYVSCLIYDDDTNPLFAPWSNQGGGGPPSLWQDSLLANDEPWSARSIDCLQSMLDVEKLRLALAKAVRHLNTDLAARVQADFEDPDRQVLLSLRRQQLISVLSQPHYMIHDWDL